MALAGSANAGPIARFAAVGGYDTSAPGHRDDGYLAGAGYRFDPLSVEVDYAYLDYDGADGFCGGAQELGALLETKLVSATCHPGRTCSHLDLDLGVGRRWVRWEPEQIGFIRDPKPVIERQGREVSIGLAATFGFHFALRYAVFAPDPGPPIVCRGVCPMRVQGSAPAVLFEAGFTFGE